MAPPETEEKRPTTLYGNLMECPICLGPIKNPAETPCGHVACYEHLKAWGKPLVEGGQAKAGCPVCNVQPTIQDVLAYKRSPVHPVQKGVRSQGEAQKPSPCSYSPSGKEKEHSWRRSRPWMLIRWRSEDLGNSVLFYLFIPCFLLKIDCFFVSCLYLFRFYGIFIVWFVK